MLLLLSAALKIFIFYLISLSSIITIALSVGMTIYWYNKFTLVRYCTPLQIYLLFFHNNLINVVCRHFNTTLYRTQKAS